MPHPDSKPLRSAIFADVQACWDAVAASDSQLARRNYIRAASAAVEASVAVMKQQAIAQMELGYFRPTRAEAAALFEEAYHLDKHGVPTVRPVSLVLRNNVKFTFLILARSHGLVASPDYNDQGWVRFLRLLEIRNRIVHPTLETAFEISDKDLADAQYGVGWFLVTLTDLLMKAKPFLEEMVQAQQRAKG